MILLKLCRTTLIRFFVVLVIISSLLDLPAYSQESEDSQVFISGFNAYQQKDFATTIKKMNEVLQKFPDTPLRDMVLFWLSRAYYKNGNQQDAAKFMSQFSKEYPDNPLKGTVDDELLALTARYDNGEKLPTSTLFAADADRLPVTQKTAPETIRATKEKNEKEQLAKEQAERERIAAAKAEEVRVAAAETARLATAKIAEERKQSEVAEQLRLIAVKRDEERKAAEKTEQLKVEREKAELARLAELQKEQERIAVAKVQEERTAQEKAAVARHEIEVAEQQKLAALKAEEERKASERLKTEQAQLEKAEHEKLVSQQDELIRLALEKAEKKRIAAEKAEADRNAADNAIRAVKYEKRRLAALKKEQEQAAAAKETARLDALKKDEERKLAEKAEQQRIAREKAEQERKAAANESARLAAIQKELEIKTAAKVEEERLAQEKIALARRAAAEAEQKKLALLKQEQERIATERVEKERLAVASIAAAQQAAAKQEQLRHESEKPVSENTVSAPIPVKRDEHNASQQRVIEEKNNANRAALREKAISQYKSILVAYPNTKASSVAAAKLKDLGVAVALPTQVAVPESVHETAQILRLEVAQFAGLEFNLLTQPQAYNVAQRISLPFVITNQGNGSDSFYLESGFPADFSASFSSAATPTQAINQTNVLAPGESFKGLINLTIPAASIDGLRISHPIKASSRTMAEATQSREVRVIAAAPLLRATVKADRSNPLPGEKITYRVAVLNVGSTGAQDISFRLNFPPQLDPVDYVTSGFRQEMKAVLVVDGIQLKSGESREFSLTFQLKDGSLAGQEILTRAELQNNSLKTNSVYVSTAAYVQPQHGLLVQPGSERLVVIPGQKVAVPFVVTNTGNVREKFSVASSGKGGQPTTIFHDLNRDGIRQANEPVITEIGPLAAKEEASIVMEIVTPRTAIDGSEDSIQIAFRSDTDTSKPFAGITKLIYSRPVLQMAMSGRDGRLKPGEVASFDLTITNHGSNLARIVNLQSAWPEQLELVAADPANNSISNGTIVWKFIELGAGEKRVIKVSFRVKPGTGMGTNIQVKNILTYEDQIGNRY